MLHLIPWFDTTPSSSCGVTGVPAPVPVAMSEIVAGGAMIPDKLEEVYLDATRDAIGDVKSVKLDVLVGAVTESDADARLELTHPTNKQIITCSFTSQSELAAG